MRRCDVCGCADFNEERVEEIFRIEGQMVMVEHIPATLCDRCGNATFERETVEGVRRTIHEGTRPLRQVSLDVFAFP